MRIHYTRRGSFSQELCEYLTGNAVDVIEGKEWGSNERALRDVRYIL